MIKNASIYFDQILHGIVQTFNISVSSNAGIEPGTVVVYALPVKAAFYCNKLHLIHLGYILFT
jgi:hypothetical protein